MIGTHRVSAFVITLNEERNIGDCLDGLKWADEIVVVDSGSTDRTVEIARQYTDRVLANRFEGFLSQFRYAADQTTHAWILWLDADERFTPEALAQVRSALDRPAECEYAGFAFPRKAMFLNRWILHSGWYPQHKTRLWRRDSGGLVGEDPHPHVAVDGPVCKLAGDILHYTYPGGVRDMVGTSVRYAADAAQARAAKGRRFSLASMLMKPPMMFVKKYVLQRGFMDGMPGLIIALGAAYYRFVREAAMWQLMRADRQKP